MSEQLVKYQIFSQYYMKTVRQHENADDHDPKSGLNPANCMIEV